MKRLLIITVAAGLLAALAPATGSAHTDRQLHALFGCMVRSPVSQFPDYTWYGLLGAPQPSSANVPPSFAGFDPANPATYPPADPPLRNWGPTTGLDLAYGTPPDIWLLGVKNTAACRKKFKLAPNPNPRAVPARHLQLARIR